MGSSLNGNGSIPAEVMAWARQLAAAEWLHDIVKTSGGRQVEVRFFCHRGRVSKEPMVIVNGGPKDMVDPDEEVARQAL